MNITAESSILLIGLAGTGKTNFLVGLDVILDEQSEPDGLVHSNVAADRAYLQPLREQWLRGEELKHTSRQSPPPPHQLLVIHKLSGQTASFYIPDLAGETFDAHFITRSLPKDLCSKIEHARGLILFIHFDHEADHAIHEDALFVDPVQTLPPNQPSSLSHSNEKQWRIEDAAKQVKLVDLLQFIAELRSRATPIRVAVAISAWDRVEKIPKCLENEIPKEPIAFVSKRWPLLSQFLEGNQNKFLFRVFGVSARGGGTTPEDIVRLTSFSNPRDRIELVDGTDSSADLTRPIRWLLGFLDPEPISDVE